MSTQTPSGPDISSHADVAESRNATIGHRPRGGAYIHAPPATGHEPMPRTTDPAADNDGTTEFPGLLAIAGRFRWRLVLCYFLFSVESLAQISQPLVLGWAVNDLIASRWYGAVALACQHMLQVVLGVLRRMYDTRAFTFMYTTLVTDMVHRLRGEATGLSSLAARSTLCRDLVQCFELLVPSIFMAGYAIIGSTCMLASYNTSLLLGAVLLLSITGFVSRWQARRNIVLHKNVNDELERQVEILRSGDVAQVELHYRGMSANRVRVSDCEAGSFAAVHTLSGVLLITVLIVTCGSTETTAGDLLAVSRYCWIFVMGVSQLPLLTEHIARVRDIGQRLTGKPTPYEVD